MKYYNEILDLGVFTRQDAEQIIGNEKTTDSFLWRSLKKEYIKRIKHNYYVVTDIVNDSSLCNKYEIATKLNKDNYVAYHSALEYYGYNNQVFNEIIYCGKKRTKDFEFDSISYHFVESKCDLQIQENYDRVRITSLERTMVDCIDRMDLAGGIEEMYRAFDCIGRVDEKKIIEILDFYDKKILYQRAGFIFETFNNKLHISDSILNYIHSKIGSSKCYLISSKKMKNTMLDKKWNVCIPTYISQILTKGGYGDEF